MERLDDGAKAGAHRSFRYLLHHEMPEEEEVCVRLSDEYVSSYTFAVQAKHTGKIARLAQRELPEAPDWPNEETWRGYAATNRKASNSEIGCRAVFARKCEIDEIEFQLHALGKSLGRLEHADVETDTLIELRLDRYRAKRKRRFPARLLFQSMAGGLAVLMLVAVVDLAARFEERAGLAANIERLGGKPPAWSVFPPGSGQPRQRPDLEGILGDRVSAAALIRHVEELIPGDVTLTSFRISRTELRVTGQARSMENLVQRVAESDLLGDVQLAAPTVRLEGRGIFVFSIKARVKGYGAAMPEAS